MIRKYNKDMAKSSKPVVGQMKKCEQIKTSFLFFFLMYDIS